MKINLARTLHEIILKSFLHLRDKNITIHYDDLFNKEDCYCVCYCYPTKFEIKIDHSLQNKRKAIIGAIVHELNHIVWYVYNPQGYHEQDYKLYKEELIHRHRDEVYTDLQTILYGYGFELLELMEHYQKYPTEEYTNGTYCGLKAQEIKRLI